MKKELENQHDNGTREFLGRLEDAGRIVFFTGAGISTESGVPDYRSPKGIWTRYEPVYYQDFVSSHTARQRYWKMKSETHALYRNVTPNITHRQIATLVKTGKVLGVITQNVDGLHRESGVTDRHLIELHGTDRLVNCLDCNFTDAIDAYFERLGDPPSPPRCPHCEGFLKPATISFGQMLRTVDLDRALAWSARADLFVVMGSSLQVQPAARFPVIAKDHGAFLAIINRNYTPLDMMADFVFNGEMKDFWNVFKGASPL